MSLRDDEFFSKEATLINRCKRELVNGVDKELIYKLRLSCLTKGCNGILEVSKIFHKMDGNGSKSLSTEEFTNCLREAGLVCTDVEIRKLINQFDVDKTGNINMTEFLAKLRPPMTRNRINVVNNAFDKIDKNGDGLISIMDLKNMYNVRDHPKYLSGDWSENKIMTEFLNNFEGNGRSGEITKEEFLNYYAGISASLESDAYFDLVMRRAYKL